MHFLSLMVIFSSIVGLSLSYPQDAEVVVPTTKNVPTTTDKTSTDDYDDVVVVNLRPSVSNFHPFSDIFRRLFGGSSFPFFSDEAGDAPSFPAFFPRPIFPDFSDDGSDSHPGFPFSFPDMSEYPDNYDNSTYEVRDINGTKVEVNRTISKSKGSNGIFIQEVQVIRYSPQNDTEMPIIPEEAENKTTTDKTTTNEASTTPSTIAPENNNNTSENEIPKKKEEGVDNGLN